VSYKIINVILSFLTGRSGFVDVDGHNSSLTKIPIGCIQGSVLGPILFNIYTRKLQDIVGKETFCVSYADDCYVGLACERDNLDETLDKLSRIASDHIEWLESIGMVPNVTKTEFIAFGSSVPLSLLITNSSINSCKNLKILGVNFSDNLSWSDHVTKTIKKCNSLGYTLKYLDSLLSREHHKRIIESHFCSVLYYGSPIWAGCLSTKDIRRLNSLMFKK